MTEPQDRNDALDALRKANALASLQSHVVVVLNERLSEFGLDGARRLTAIRALAPALLAHLDGDPSPVPDRHAFIDFSGEVRLSSALNSERAQTPSGVVLYMNLRTVADTMRPEPADAHPEK